MYPWVESFGIEPGKSNTEYFFRALLCVPEVIDDMQRAMVDFPDDFRTTVSFGCLSSTISERYETSTLVFTDGSKSADGMGFVVYFPGVRQVENRLMHEPA
jgi:hypothetical protein